MNTIDFPIELKALGDDGSFEGYGAVFSNVDLGNDRVLPGAFVESLTRHRREGTSVKMLWNHNPSEPIGIWEDLAEDSKGLWGKGQLILDVARAREVHALMKRKAIGGLSIGYATIEDKVEAGVRLLKKVDLWEVSPVTFPMNDRARIESVKTDQLGAALRAFAIKLRDGTPPQIKDFEGILREAGVPKSMAVAIASHGYAKAIRSESEGTEASAAAFLKALRAKTPSLAKETTHGG